ncbi:hypothetical protein HPP92_003986 [Vanilla planifolia]|uniref:Uncharacterized protein n=1 Tax=Vanilla planifolia TaxID=51239 RepID=A0A835S465_VANPL|nr:hypothetical protein HPP92_004424 [Vanilla planifolia]KAG0503914.1 hypothetical protein HPP92_003986 [Vanilla planifolia]
MPAMEHQGSSVSFTALGRSLLSLRREQVDAPQEPSSSDDTDLDSFQRHVTDLFANLSSADGDELLSLLWVRKLLDAFLLCHEEFRVILFNKRSVLSRPPMDCIISEYHDRSVKALDVCNAIRDGIEQVRQWQKHLEIVLIALNSRWNPVGVGQLRRAKKAVADLAMLMLDEKDSASVLAQRNRSFGHSRPSSGKDQRRAGGHLRSLSWSISRSWSASKQLQSIGNNICAPRGHEVVATGSLSNPVFTMNMVIYFVMWALVAAIPCQDRGLQAHFSIPRSFPWGSSVHSLHERIMEESKKKERKNSVGLLKEIHQIEKCTRKFLELTDSLQYPLPAENMVALGRLMQDFTAVYDSINVELEQLELQVREVFQTIVRSRTESLDYFHEPE